MRERTAWAGGVAGLLVLVAIAAAGWGEDPGALTNWQALVLGLVQGATELLPISSSGHLILVPWLGEWTVLRDDPEFNQTFDVALHLGTLVAVVAYFRRDIVGFLRGWLRTFRTRRIETADERIAWFVFVATIPAVIAGGLGESWIADNLGEPWQIAILLAVFGVVLWLADRRPQERRIEDLGLTTAVAVGVAQSLALAPGVSRSGITITAARFLGLDRDSAARFSFLLLIPTVFGAVIYKGFTEVVLGDLPAGWEGPFVVGTLAAALSGLAAIRGLLGYVRRHDYSVFVVYRLLAATIVLLLITSGVREAGF